MICRKCDQEIPEKAKRCPSCKTKVLSKKDDPLLGRTLAEKYVLKKKLGEGSFGAVYEAEDTLSGQKVAIKTLHPHLTRNPSVVERFRREGIAAGRLEHPCAVKIYDNGETEDHRFWIAMELLIGKPLDEYLIRNGPLSPGDFLQIMEPVCEVLAEAHEKGIIHRDLKPQNIFIVTTEEGMSAKPLDFGISKVMEAGTMTQSGIMMGTPAYMSPEQWEGAKHTTPVSDIYALGVISYQCLSGKLPFKADTAASWMRHHCFTAPADLNGLLAGRLFPPRLGKVVMKALAKAPAARYATTMELLQALKDAARETPVVLAPQPITESGGTRESRSTSTLVLEIEKSSADSDDAKASRREALKDTPRAAGVPEHPEPQEVKKPARPVETKDVAPLREQVLTPELTGKGSPSSSEKNTPSAKEAPSSSLRVLGLGGGLIALLLLLFWASGLSSSLFPTPSNDEVKGPTPKTAPVSPPKPPPPPRFLVQDGTVTDAKTGLMWAEEDSKKALILEEAKQYCKGLKQGGHTDWRIPTRKELETLYTLDIPGHAPYCDRLRQDPEFEVHHYPEVKIGCYGFWTADAKEGRNYVFSFQTGSTFTRPPTSKVYVLPVRGAKRSREKTER